MVDVLLTARQEDGARIELRWQTERLDRMLGYLEDALLAMGFRFEGTLGIVEDPPPREAS